MFALYNMILDTSLYHILNEVVKIGGFKMKSVLPISINFDSGPGRFVPKLFSTVVIAMQNATE